MTVSNERVVECPYCFGAHRVITVEGPHGRLTVIPCEDMSAKVGWLAFHDMPPSELRLLRQLALSQQLANEGNPVAKQAAVEALEEWGRRFPQDGGEG